MESLIDAHAERGRAVALIGLLLLLGSAPVQAARGQMVSDTTAPSPAALLPADTLQPLTALAVPQVAALGGNQSVYRPYRQEPSVYFGAPPLRYNRVEGAVVGLQYPPLSWNDDAALQPFGQVSYALGIRRWRAVGGLEARLVQPSSLQHYGLKVGGHVAHTTASEDVWKRSWQDNAVSALVFGNDLYNYYDVRAVTAYVTQRFSSALQLTVGGRWGTHDTLPRTTDWSLLDPSAFRPNPPVDTGEVRLLLLSAEGGHLTRRTEARSVGTIARLYAELGRWAGASLAYDRVIVDVQTYQAVTPSANVNLRGRVGWATADAPIQMQFRLDGVRGLRNTEPVGRAEERLLLGGAEWVWHDAPVPSWLRRAQVSVFTDVGWTGNRLFRDGQTFAFAGLGAGLFGRMLTVDVAWNLMAPRPDAWTPQVSVSVNPLR